METKFCTHCGESIAAAAELCPKCGVRVAPPPSAGSGLGPTTANGRNRMTAALIAFFLGGIGGHKFYLGQAGMGIFYLLFCWTFIPAFIAFIEFIILITMSDDAFAAKYG